MLSFDRYCPRSHTKPLAEAYPPGTRIQLHPGTDRWMRGDRYGTVERAGRKLVYIKMDVSGDVARVHPSNLQLV